MSVVAVKIYDKEIIMSADSIIIRGDDKTPIGRGKIFEVNGMLIGFCGLASEGVHMTLFAENHTPLSMDDRELTKYMYEFMSWRMKEFGAEKKLERRRSTMKEAEKSKKRKWKQQKKLFERKTRKRVCIHW